MKTTSRINGYQTKLNQKQGSILRTYFRMRGMPIRVWKSAHGKWVLYTDRKNAPKARLILHSAQLAVLLGQ